MDRALLLIGNLLSLDWTGGVDYPVPFAAQGLTHERADHLVVFDQQDRLRAGGGFPGLVRRLDGGGLIDAGKVDFDGCASAGFAVDLHRSAALLDDSEDGRKSEAGSLP